MIKMIRRNEYWIDDCWGEQELFFVDLISSFLCSIFVDLSIN